MGAEGRLAKLLVSGGVKDLSPEMLEKIKADPELSKTFAQYLKDGGESAEKGVGKSAEKTAGNETAKSGGQEPDTSKNGSDEDAKSSNEDAKSKDEKDAEALAAREKAAKKKSKALDVKDLEWDNRKRDWNNKLRIPKAVMGSKIGKIVTWGTLGSYLLTGNMMLPLAALHGMQALLGGAVSGLASSGAGAVAGMGLLGGLGSTLMKPMENANKTVDKADRHVRANHPYGATEASLAHDEGTALQNSVDSQQGAGLQNGANHYMSRDDAPEAGD